MYFLPSYIDLSHASHQPSGITMLCVGGLHAIDRVGLQCYLVDAIDRVGLQWYLIDTIDRVRLHMHYICFSLSPGRGSVSPLIC